MHACIAIMFYNVYTFYVLVDLSYLFTLNLYFIYVFLYSSINLCHMQFTFQMFSSLCSRYLSLLNLQILANYVWFFFFLILVSDF